MAIDNKDRSGNIDPEISQLAVEFAQMWSDAFASLPRYQLDFSWPSVTSAGLIYEVALRKNNGSIPDDFLRGLASYIGVIGLSVWQVYTEKSGAGETELRISDDRILMRKISSAGDDLLAEVDLLSALRNLHSEQNFKYPATLADELRPFTGLRKLAIEIFSASSPLISGPWASQSVEQQRRRFVSFDLSIAESTAAYFLRIAPSEPELANMKLYLAGPLSPPSGINEPGLFSTSTLALHNNLLAIFPDDAVRYRATVAITSCMDPQLACSAFLLCLCSEHHHPSNVSRLGRIGFYLTPIAQHLKIVTELIQKGRKSSATLDIYKDLASDTQRDPAEVAEIINHLEDRIELEKLLGFFYDLPLNIQLLLSIPKLFPALYMNRYDLVVNILAANSDQVIKDEELSLLLIYSNIQIGNTAAAKEAAEIVRHNHNKRLAERSPFSALFYKLVGDIVYLGGDLELASGFYRDALDRCPDAAEPLMSQLFTSQGIALLDMNLVEEAEKCLTEAYKLDSTNRRSLELAQTDEYDMTEAANSLRNLPYSLNIIASYLSKKVADT